uniref:DUF4378 domain-containing protein n=1 Tax=Leersia perrieri TaxID=77586 RepID=A0A0D9VNQ5_9ORYZ
MVRRSTMPPPPPLTLRDFLEQSSSEGFRSYPRYPVPDDVDNGSGGSVVGGGGGGDHLDDLAPPVRLLIEAGLRRSPSTRLPPSFYGFFHKSPGTLAKISRSLSRRFRDGFSWRRRENDGDDDDIGVDERDEFGWPSPVVSSCSSSDTEEEMAMENLASASASEKEEMSQSSTGSVAFEGAADAGGDGHNKEEEVDGEPVGRNLEMEDKQQLSPVSIMDFPFDDDDDDEGGGEEVRDAGAMCSPSFEQCLAELQRSKAELVHKIRRLEGLTQVVVPVDLDAQSTESDSSPDTRTHLNSNNSSSDDTATSTPTTTSPRADVEQQKCTDVQDDHRLLFARLVESSSATDDDENTAWLLHDFFAEGVDRLRASGKPVTDREEAALAREADAWARGAGQRWGVRDVVFSGGSALAEMERSRRWMCVGEEERDVGAEVEALVVDALVDELLRDLAR